MNETQSQSKSDSAEYVSSRIESDKDRAERAEKWADELGRKCCQLQDENAKLKAELDQAQKACAEMRQILDNVDNCCCDLQEWDCISGDAVRHALSSDCGKGYFSREQVRPLIEALNKVEGFGRGDMGHQAMCDYVTESSQTALAHAKALGMDKEKQ